MNEEILALIQKKKLLEEKIGGMVYGAIEIRKVAEKENLYVHFRLGGQQITRYVGENSKELFELITENNIKVRPLKAELKEIKHKLHELGYTETDLPEKVKRNLDFAKRNLSLTIHSQAILEGVATTFASTEDIIEGARVEGMSTKDVAKIVNMKHAWEFILDEDVITAKSDLGILMQINKLVEEGFYYNAGKLRDVPVRIGGTAWAPEMPIASKVSEDLNSILDSHSDAKTKAINLLLYVQRSQLFLDGNKRTAVIFANHYLISRGLGLIYIPAELTEEYKKLLVAYYEAGKKTEIFDFLKQKCLLEI